NRTDVGQGPLVSVFAPDRLELVKGPPAVRRAHLDRLVAAIWPLRAEDRRAYGRVLSQRNALIGRVRSGRASPATFAAWDRELARTGLAVRANRATAVELLLGQFTDRGTRLGWGGALSLQSRPGGGAAGEVELGAEADERSPRG